MRVVLVWRAVAAGAEMKGEREQYKGESAGRRCHTARHRRLRPKSSWAPIHNARTDLQRPPAPRVCGWTCAGQTFRSRRPQPRPPFSSHPRPPPPPWRSWSGGGAGWTLAPHLEVEIHQSVSPVGTWRCNASPPPPAVATCLPRLHSLTNSR